MVEILLICVVFVFFKFLQLIFKKNHENDKLQEELDAVRAERDELK